MALSDEEVFGAPAAPAAPAVMSDADIWGAPKPVGTPEPEYLPTLGRKVKGYADAAGEAVSAPFKPDDSAGPEWLQRIGDIGGRAATILGSTAGTVLSPAEAGFSSGAGYIMPEIAKSVAGRELTPEERMRIQQTADDTGQLMTMAAFTPSAPIKANPAMPVDRAILDALDNAPGKARSLLSDTSSGNAMPDFKAIGSDAKSMLTDQSSGLPGAAIPKNSIAPIDSAQVHQSISDMYKGALAQSKQNYNAVRDIGEGLDIPVKGLRQQLDDILKDIGDDPLHEGRSALADLRRIRDKIGDESSVSGLVDQYGKPLRRTTPDMVSANDLLDIKQYLNEGFNPKRFAERGDNPYFTLQKTVKKNLSDIADMHPPFGDALKTADKFWVNNVDLPYRSNEVLHRFWKPDDYNAMQSMERGVADALPSATMERQYLLLRKLRNPVEFEALRNALPPGAREEFAQSLMKNIKDEAGAGIKARAKNLAKAVGHSIPAGPYFKPITAARELGKAAEPGMDAMKADIIKSIKGEKYASGGAVKVNSDPTPAQKMAGNYKKHHIKFHGLDIAIENPKGSERNGVDKSGKKWSVTMPNHYGYIKRTQGADDSHIDVYIGDDESSKRAYVIDQKDLDTGKFDEHKVCLGYKDRGDAVAAYRSAFSDGKNRIMKVTRFSIPELKDWLKNGDTRKPAQAHTEEVRHGR